MLNLVSLVIVLPSSYSFSSAFLQLPVIAPFFIASFFNEPLFRVTFHETLLHDDFTQRTEFASQISRRLSHRLRATISGLFAAERATLRISRQPKKYTTIRDIATYKSQSLAKRDVLSGRVATCFRAYLPQSQLANRGGELGRDTRKTCIIRKRLATD